MASIENDDDDFLASPQEDALPSPRKSLKRLKKKADKKSEVPKSPRKADSISVLDFSSSTDPSFRSTQELSPSVDLERHSKPTESQSAELPWNLCAKGGDDNPLLESNFEMGPTKFSEDIPSDAKQEDIAGLHPDENQDNDELDDCDAEDGSRSESEEEVDENDEMAVLNLLGKGRKPSEKGAHRVPSLQTPPASLHAGEAAGTTHKKKKIKAAELEEMHAASQRLLRETPNASFKLQVSTGKSITSVLEKIRLRKMQLVQGWKSASIVHPSEDAMEKIDQELLCSKKFPPHAEDEEVEDVGTQENECQEILQCNVNKNAEGDKVRAPEEHAEGDVSHVRTPEKLAAGYKSDDMEKSACLGSGNVFRAPMEDTQDLLSPSQSSQEDIGGNLNLDTEEDNIFGGSRVNLHFDTETQDDYEQWQDEEGNKENMEPTLPDRLFNVPIAKGPSVRALIDDEAEDEDEDILVPGEEDEGDEGEDLQGMVIEETNEKEQDQEKRAELHRKWLEQQDAVMTDDILLRLKTGWRPRESRKRGLDFLDDEMELIVQKDRNVQDPDPETEPQEFQESPDENSQDVEVLRDEANQDEARAFSFPEDLNDVHESDDEEAEQRMMRQRFLQESEEQGDLMSPADDETSREIFVLINKVNIASSNKKLKQGSVNDLRYLGGGTSNSNSSFTSKSSFLRRSVSSTMGSVQRQGSNSGSGTRSFIFGRDDSNSSHSFDQHMDMREIKENLEPTSQGLRKETPHNKQCGQGHNSKVTKTSATRLGPSLFEILRRQSTNLDQSLQKKSFDEGSPILAAFKPIKSTNTPRGARRA